MNKVNADSFDSFIEDLFNDYKKGLVNEHNMELKNTQKQMRNAAKRLVRVRTGAILKSISTKTTTELSGVNSLTLYAKGKGASLYHLEVKGYAKPTGGRVEGSNSAFDAFDEVTTKHIDELRRRIR